MGIIRFLIKKSFYSRKTLIAMALLIIYAIAITAARYWLTLDNIEQYYLAGMEYRPQHALVLWLGYQEAFIGSSEGLVQNIIEMLSDLFPVVIIPLLLTLLGTDSYYDDRKAGMINIIKTKTAVNRYYLLLCVYIFLKTFLIIAFFYGFQLAAALLTNKLWLSEALPAINSTSVSVLEIMIPILKLSLYYSALAAATYCISLLLNKVLVIIILLPLLLSFGVSVITIRIWQNDPLALAFYESGLAKPDQKVYWIYICFLLCLSIAAFIGRLIIDRNEVADA